MARASGMVRGSRWVPPAPGMIAHLTSARPSRAWSAAILKSQASTISRPPASATPLMAAMMGLKVVTPRVIPPKFQSSMTPSPWAGISVFRSAPAEKALFPAPVRIATHRLSSSRNSSQTFSSSWLCAMSSAFIASGRSIVTTARRPSRSNLILILFGLP